MKIKTPDWEQSDIPKMWNDCCDCEKEVECGRRREITKSLKEYPHYKCKEFIAKPKRMLRIEE